MSNQPQIMSSANRNPLAALPANITSTQKPVIQGYANHLSLKTPANYYS